MSDYGTLKVGDVEYEIVEQVDPDLGYEWHIGALLRSPDGGLHWAADRGCSCYYFGEDVTPDDLVPVKSWQEAVELAKVEFEHYDDDVARFAERLMALHRSERQG